MDLDTAERFCYKLLVLLLLFCNNTLSAAPIPDWLAHEALAASEQHRHEIDIECYAVQGPVCITLAEWCRIHTRMGEPVHEVCAVRRVYPRYGQ